MQKEKAMVYSLDIEFCPVIRHKNLLKNYEIVKLVAPTGWGFNGKDAAVIDGGPMTGMIVENDYSKALKECDTVIFCDCVYYPDIENTIYSKMEEAIQNKKNIVSLVNIEVEDQKELIELSKINHTYVEFLYSVEESVDRYLNKRHTLEISEWEYRSSSSSFEEIHKIDTPIVFVMGVTERNCKFEIQLAIREKLQDIGYKVSQIGSRNYCELLGFNSFPSFMYSNSFSEVDKVIMFNNYIKEIEKEQNPDIIIIGIPGGTMKVNNKYTNKLGLYAYEISQAIEPDYVIMSTFYENFKPEYIENLNISSKYRFGYEVDCFHLANVQLDWEHVLKLDSDIYNKLNNDFINKKIEQYAKNNIPLYNIFNDEHVNLMVKDIVNKLSSYSETEII